MKNQQRLIVGLVLTLVLIVFALLPETIPERH